MSYINFQIGEKFPLPLKNQGDGGMFQIDANGCMFILQLSQVDLIAIEAFRTGQLEIGLFEEKGLLFFLYRIDGIFKEGWGDAPLGIQLLPPGLKPMAEDLQEPVIHFYLLDTTSQVLLAQRQIQLSKEFFQILQTKLKEQLASSLTPDSYLKLLQGIWQKKTSLQMSKEALTRQLIPMEIAPLKPKNTH